MIKHFNNTFFLSPYFADLAKAEGKPIIQQFQPGSNTFDNYSEMSYDYRVFAFRAFAAQAADIYYYCGTGHEE